MGTYARDPGRNPNRLYRDPEEGKILGVCAGIADYFGFSPWAVRLAALGSLLVFTPATLFAYFVAGVVLSKKPAGMYASPDEEGFWRAVRTEPTQTAHDLRHRYRELERRLRAAEAYVTSREFKLNREIRDLDA